MPCYSLECSINPDNADVAMGLAWSIDGMTGCEEAVGGNESRFQFFLNDEAALSLLRTTLIDRVDAVQCESAEVIPQDYNAEWRKTMKPARIAGHLLVGPDWLKPEILDTGDQWITIEPAMAFGTGHHETTRLCAKALSQCHKKSNRPGSLLDIGTGSGILCFLASLLNIPSVGVEIDPVCAENIAKNRSDNPDLVSPDFLIGSLSALKERPHFSVVLMNMILTESAPCLPVIQKLCIPGAMLVWSGLLYSDKENALGCAREVGFVLREEFEENEWWCGVFGRDV